MMTKNIVILYVKFNYLSTIQKYFLHPATMTIIDDTDSSLRYINI